MVSILDEKVLVEQCRKRHRYAQKILFDKYFNKMMTVCLRYLKNEEDALEALNNAFLKVFAKINQYKSEGTLEAWIKRIVINSSIDFVRSNKLYRANFIHTNEFRLYGEPEEENTLMHEGFDVLEFSKEEIFEMVEDLPPATRVVFNLYVVDEFSHQQISENLKISEGTSKWHLSNARKILKEKISKAVIVKNKNLNHGEEKAEHR
ncbi:MAG TPA: RNA polymerase sigma factor [Bacteroidia bacterium]|nr:RNA polymerase sigma factor [Bacteroidia bacterium]